MITKNELRIGNYLESDGRDMIITGHYLSNMEKGMKPDNPIPITEEWLINFGFEETYNSEFRHKFDHKINNFIGFDFSKVEDKSMEGLRYYGIYIKVKYFHELQNLYFALTKQELELIKSETTK